MNQHFRAVPDIPNPLSPLAPNKNPANYESARDENVLLSAPGELLKPLGQSGTKNGWDPSAPGPARGCWGMELGTPGAGDTQNPGQSWGRTEPGTLRTLGATRAPLHKESFHKARWHQQHPQHHQSTLCSHSPPGCERLSGCPGAQTPSRGGFFGIQKPPRLPGPAGAARAGTRLGSAGRGARCGFTALPGTNGFKLP